MPDSVLVDNDVILKTCCYDAIDEVVECVAGDRGTIYILGVARYVLNRVISKGRNVTNKAQVAVRFVKFLENVALIEPTESELCLAAEFEETAQSCGLNLDGGESQLLAVLIQRSASLLVTGDKRAIRAMEPILKSRGFETQVARKIACLEQLIAAVLNQSEPESLRERICSEEAIDITMAICFSCASRMRDVASIRESLASYIRDLRSHAPSVLVDSDDLSTVVSKKDGIR